MAELGDGGDHTAKLSALLRQLAGSRADLGLELEPSGRGFVPLTAIPRPVLNRWLADSATLGEEIDERTAAAYLLSILVWKLGEILAALHLGGIPLDVVIAVQHAVTGVGKSRYIQFRFAISSDAHHGPHRPSANQAIVDLHEPLVTALHERTGLSRRALWRLVTDGVAGGFLECGKASGDLHRSKVEAITVLSLPRSPLHNRQWRFIEIAPDTAAAEWFRLRGGCCRLYRSVGGSYCTTCVVRPAAEQVERLHAFVARRRSP